MTTITGNIVNKNIGVDITCLGSVDPDMDNANCNIAYGFETLNSFQEGFENTAVGYRAMKNNTHADACCAFGYLAGGSSYTCSFGWRALSSVNINNMTLNACAFGFESLRNMTTGNHNSAYGSMSGRALTTGNFDTLIGSSAGINMTTAEYNTCVGFESGNAVTTGLGNTLVGVRAGLNVTSGPFNNLFGVNAGYNNSTGGYNVCLGSYTSLNGNVNNCIVLGVGMIGIGVSGSFTCQQLRAYSSSFALPVYQNSNNELFRFSSSKRYKKNIQTIDHEENVDKVDTSKLYDLRPVTYKSCIEKSDDDAVNIGLIAEEVNEFFPHLVPKDETGQPDGVNYACLSVLIINEMKKLKAENDKLNDRLNLIEKNLTKPDPASGCIIL